MNCKSRVVRWLIVPVFMLLITLPVKSQTYQFKNYNVEEGLNGSFIYTVNQDSRGFIWLGTSGGISIFDGFDFHTVSTPDSAGTGFPVSSSDLVDGRVIFGFSNGAAYITDGSLLSRIRGIDAFRINEVLQDEDGVVLLLTQSKGVYRLHPGSNVQASRLSSPEDYIIYCGAIAGKDKLLLGTQQGLFLATVSEDRIIPDFEVDELHFLKVQTIVKDPLSPDYYVGTEDDGLFRVNISGESPIVSRILEEEAFNQTRVQSVMFDGGGDMWISTFGNGIVKLEMSDDRSTVIRRTDFTREKGLAGNDIRRVYQDNEGNIWIGHFGNGISVMASDAYSLLLPGEGENMNNIIAIWEQDGLIFAGTERGFYLYNLEQRSTVSYTDLGRYTGSSRITTFCRQPEGGFIFGTESDGAFRYNRGAVSRYFFSQNNLENYIADIKCDSRHNWIATRSGVVMINLATGARRTFTTYDNLPHNSINQVLPDGNGRVFVATQGNRLYTIDPAGGVIAGKAVIYGGGRTEFQCFDLDDSGTVWGATLGKGVYGFAGDSLRHLSSDDGLLNNYCYSILADRNGNIWIGHEQGFSVYDRELGQVRTFVDIFDSGADYNENSISETESGLVLMGTTSGFMVYNPSIDRVRLIPPRTNIMSVEINGVEMPLQQHYVLPYRVRHDIRINYTGLYYTDPEKVYYRYRMDNYDDEWSDPSYLRSAGYKLSNGNYHFNLISYNYDGITDNSVVGFDLTIKKPVWRMWWFIGIMLLLASLVIGAIIRYREKAQKRVKDYLERELEERTREVITQKEEIELQNREITDSINYAQRIQAGLLPATGKLDQVFQGSFTFYRPRDIVSGDFYWFDFVSDDRFIMVCADSTGHGVPGAFMSMIGSALIQEIVLRKEITRPSQILSTLDAEISSTLNQGESGNKSSDGMDIIVCEFNIKTGLLRFASAMRPVILVMDGEQFYIRGNKSSVGGESVGEKYFDDQEYYLKKGDIVYMFSDGYPDQFGGPFGKKLKILRMKNLIDEIKDSPMNEQYEMVSAFFEEWKGELDQVDDVLFMGVMI